MAKTNPIVLVGAQGDEDLANQILRAEAPTFSLGAVAMNALADAPDAMSVVVDFPNRQVQVFTAAQLGAVQADLGGTEVAVITRDDTEKRVSSHSVEGGDDVGEVTNGAELLAALELAVSAVKPKRSLSALVSAVEDVLSELGDDSPDEVRLVIDQTGDGHVSVMAETAAVDAVAPKAAIEQLADAEEEGPEPLAWE